MDGLRVLVAELRSLVDRLELKERSHNLQSTLKTAEQRLAGPRAVVMLLSEHEELKRRFLERLLGPKLAQVPKPTTACIRLEYGIAPECSVSMPLGLTAGETPGRMMETIRLPNPTLKSGVALIDTPVLASGEPDATTLKYAEEADAWILVLNADHALSEASQALLRRLPDGGARLEIVVENADGLSNEERLAARDRLIRTLREHCKVEAPRLTLVASAATEGDGASFWHGRFATFHSVMMLRGREHWLRVTRTMVSDALAEVNAEIEFALKSIAPGLREGRLRLGMKDLEGLRTRFDELERLEGERPQERGAAEAAPKVVEESRSAGTGSAQAAGPDQSTMTSPEPMALTNAGLVSVDAADAVVRLSPGQDGVAEEGGRSGTGDRARLSDRLGAGAPGVLLRSRTRGRVGLPPADPGSGESRRACRGRRQSGTAEARRSRFPAGDQRTGDPEYLRGRRRSSGALTHGCRFRTRYRAVPPRECRRQQNGIIGTFSDWASCGTGCGTATASTTLNLNRRRLTRTQVALLAIRVAIFCPSGEPRPVHGSQPGAAL